MISKKDIKLLSIGSLTIVISILLFKYGGHFNILSLATTWIGSTIYTVEIYKKESRRKV